MRKLKVKQIKELCKVQSLDIKDLKRVKGGHTDVFIITDVDVV